MMLESIKVWNSSPVTYKTMTKSKLTWANICLPNKVYYRYSIEDIVFVWAIVLTQTRSHTHQFCWIFQTEKYFCIAWINKTALAIFLSIVENKRKNICKNPTVKMTETFMRRFTIATCKLVREWFCTNSIYSNCIVAICNGSISSFDTP